MLSFLRVALVMVSLYSNKAVTKTRTEYCIDLHGTEDTDLEDGLISCSLSRMIVVD